MTFATAYLLPSGGRRVALRMLMPMVSAGADSCWVHVCFEGEWEGHRDGSFDFTAKKFQSMVSNFEDNLNPIPMDYLHTTENPSATEAPASGWVQKLEVRKEDGRSNLYAFCELTEKAANHIRAGEYRYCSGVFDFDAHDLVTGESIGCTMNSLALVNTPFIRGQKPIRLSQRQGAHGDDMKINKATIRALNEVKKESLIEALELLPNDEIDAEQLEAAALFARAKDGTTGEETEVTPLQEEKEKEEKKLAEEKEEEEKKELVQPPGDEQDPARLAEEGVAVDGEAAAAIAPILEKSGLDVTAFAAAVQSNLDAVVEALTGALDQPAAPAPLAAANALSLSTAQGQVKMLSTRVKTQDKQLTHYRHDEATRLVKALAEKGKILIGDAPKWVRLCLSARPTFDTLSATLQPVVLMDSHASAITPPPEAGDSEPIDESNEFVIRTRRNLRHAGKINKEVQDKAIRKGLLALKQRA